MSLYHKGYNYEGHNPIFLKQTPFLFSLKAKDALCTKDTTKVKIVKCLIFM